MIHSKLLGATTIAAVIVISACDGSSLPTAPAASGSISPTASASPSFSKSSSRRGILHATKACPKYNGNAGDFCSITSSNLEEIPAFSKVFYAKALVAGKLDSDLILVPPGRGKSVAYGHVVLDLTTRIPHGLVTFSGGTGKFKHFQATIVVLPLNGGPDWNWDGPYSFGGNDDDGDESGDQQ